MCKQGLLTGFTNRGLLNAENKVSLVKVRMQEHAVENPKSSLFLSEKFARFIRPSSTC